MKTSDFHGLTDLDPDKFAAMPLEGFFEPRLAFKGDGIRDNAPSRPERRPCSFENAVVGEASSDEHGVRRREPRHRLRRMSDHHLQAGCSKRKRVAHGARRPILPLLDAYGFERRMAQQPFDGDGASAKADVPEQLALTRRERRQRDSPNIALRQLAVAFEKVVIKSGRQADHSALRTGGDFYAHEVERADAGYFEPVCAVMGHALFRAAQIFEHGD